MDPEWEGFKQQAMALFAWQQVLRPALPEKLNSKLKRRGQRAAAKAGMALMNNRYVRERMWEAALYNVTRSEFTGYEARVYCFATLAQADAGNLAQLEEVKTQVAVCPEPRSPTAGDAIVRLRFELLLTRAEDVTYADYYLRARDLNTSGRTGTWENVTPLPPSKQDIPVRQLTALVHCAGCDKYSLTHQRCSGCRKVYYCNAECQHKHWPQHRGDCLYAQHLGPADAWPNALDQKLPL